MSDPEVLPASPSPGDDHRKRELNLREREVAAYEREITAKEAEINKSPWLNPLVIGLLVAVIGLVGSVVVTRMNNQNSQRVSCESIPDLG
jgi:Pyruvate/2-oxoacid:ferredoxin oxidoreductase gamma subunit